MSVHGTGTAHPRRGAQAGGPLTGRLRQRRRAAGCRRRQPRRLRSNACFSMLCGPSPIEASSGKTTRHRLNRGGDRQAKTALHRIVVARLRHDQQTKDYLARRIPEGKSKKEAIRCLIGRVFLPQFAWSGSCSSVGVRGMASLPSRQTASLSSATPGAPRPADRLQGHARSKGRTMRHRQHGPRHPASEHAIESRSRRCSWEQLQARRLPAHRWAPATPAASPACRYPGAASAVAAA
jgi:hypothetical protein